MQNKFIIGVLIVFISLAGVIFYFKSPGTPSEPSPTQNQPSENSRNTTGLPLQIPEGFAISIFARDLVNPRVIAFDPEGRMLVSITSEGRIALLEDLNNDGTAEKSGVLLSELNKPHGLAFRCPGKENCQLYVAESNGVFTYDYDRNSAKAQNRKKIIDLPGGEGHFTRTILFTPDDKLLVSVGSSCNVCKENDDRRAAILSANPDGSDLRIFSSGLRNSVFLSLHPQTKKIWGTDMGRDFLGDNLPPDEVNIIEEGKNYDWPYCYGKNIMDTRFSSADSQKCADTIPSFIDIPAHSAPLGLAFTPSSWPEEYKNNLIVAFHGSWNRTQPAGYKIVRYKFNSRGENLSQEDFITGWLERSQVSGRPADIKILPNGFMYISDDKSGLIYQVKPVNL